MKPTHMLDTNICIHIRRERPAAVLERFRSMEPGSVAMSTITHGELYYGIQKLKVAGDRRYDAADATLRELVTLIPVLPLEAHAATFYGTIRAELAARGETIGSNDLWIAASAMAADCILVTNNRREFDRVSGLSVEDWTVP